MSEVVKEERIIEGDVESIIDQNRVINFSDAVFAFAATLLVLKIDLPQLNPGFEQTELVRSMIHLWPQYFANIVSFLVIGYYWLTHHIIFGMVKKFTRTLVWLNIIFLIALSFLPFPVDLYGDYPKVPLVVVFYSASLAIVGYLLAIVWWYASHNHRLVDKKVTDRKIKFLTIKILVAPVVFTLSIPLVYIHPYLVQLSWVFIIVGVTIVNRKFPYKRGLTDSSV